MLATDRIHSRVTYTHFFAEERHSGEDYLQFGYFGVDARALFYYKEQQLALSSSPCAPHRGE